MKPLFLPLACGKCVCVNMHTHKHAHKHRDELKWMLNGRLITEGKEQRVATYRWGTFFELAFASLADSAAPG